MTKPHIFIAMHYLEIGGAETALIGLLQTLNPDKVDVDLFLYDQCGDMLKYVPSWVNLLPPVNAYQYIEKPLKEVVSNGQVGVAFGRILAKWKHQHYCKKKNPVDGSAIFGYVGKYVSPFLPSLKKFGEYDLAISFLTPHNYVLEKVNAKKKICWIHTDYTRMDVDAALELPTWDGYDHIVSISEDVTKTFCQVFPSLKSKVIEMENIISPSFIRLRAEEEEMPEDMPKEAGYINILTIGRYSLQKKLEEIPEICRGLLDRDINVKWYIIGYGLTEIEDEIKRNIDSFGVDENVILLGKRANPYPYIKACDWYVQPSRYEGKSITVREAQILCKPVIITNYPTAPSQVKDRIDGVIVPLSVKECIEEMSNVLPNFYLKSGIEKYLRTTDFGNEDEIKKLYLLIS